MIAVAVKPSAACLGTQRSTLVLTFLLDEVIYMQVQRKTLTQLSIPICFETLFYMLSGMVDTLMPVSYTHLDVYKRQGKRLSACEYGSTAVLGYPSTFLS